MMIGRSCSAASPRMLRQIESHPCAAFRYRTAPLWGVLPANVPAPANHRQPGKRGNPRALQQTLGDAAHGSRPPPAPAAHDEQQGSRLRRLTRGTLACDGAAADVATGASSANGSICPRSRMVAPYTAAKAAGLYTSTTAPDASTDIPASPGKRESWGPRFFTTISWLPSTSSTCRARRALHCAKSSPDGSCPPTPYCAAQIAAGTSPVERHGLMAFTELAATVCLLQIVQGRATHHLYQVGGNTCRHMAQRSMTTWVTAVVSGSNHTERGTLAAACVVVFQCARLKRSPQSAPHPYQCHARQAC